MGGTAELVQGVHGQGEQSQNEVLSAFFSSLMGKQVKGGKGKQ